MSDNELQKIIEQISIEQFGKLFSHNARFNARLRTTGGRYKLGSHDIEVNPLVLELHGLSEMIGVIKHELCHYHLHIEGKGYQHRDEDFKNLLKSTSSPRYCKALAERNKKKSATIHYKCKVCGLDYMRRRKMDVRKYKCGKCAGSIQEMTINS